MDERLLILNAIKAKSTNTPGTDLDKVFPEPDAIEKWAKRKKRQESFRQKESKDWNSADFLRYLDFMLKEFGVVRSKGNVRADVNRLDHLYDALAKRLQHKMNNAVLKSYLDWWCSIWAPRLTGSEMYLNSLLQDYQIKRFTSRYVEKESEEQVLPIPVQPQVSDEQIFDLGGLDLLVMQRGIVAGHRMLLANSVADPARALRNTLSNLTRDTLLGVMNTTIQQAYSCDDKVDFIALAQPYLQSNGLTDFLQIESDEYFRSDYNFDET